MVLVPAVLMVTANVLVPATRAALAGRVAFTSLDVMAMVFVVLTTFQLASTPLTVKFIAAPAVCAVGVPVLPLADPGSAVSPGKIVCILVNVPGITVNVPKFEDP